MRLHELNEKNNERLEEACWWVIRYVSGSIGDPDWEDDWCTMGVNEAMEIVAAAIGNTSSVGRPLNRFVYLSDAELENIRESKTLTPHPEFRFQSFSGCSVSETAEIGMEINPISHSRNPVVVTINPSPDLVLFGMADLKRCRKQTGGAYNQLDNWHHQDEVFVRCNGNIPLTGIQVAKPNSG